MEQPALDNLKKGDIISDKFQTLHFSHYETDEHGIQTGNLVCYNEESESVIIHQSDVMTAENMNPDSFADDLPDDNPDRE